MDDIIRKLADSASSEFYKGLALLRKQTNLQETEGAEVLLSAAKLMSDQGAVPNLEQAERVEGILDALNLNAKGQEILASIASARLPNYLLNSLAKVLTPLQKRALIHASEQPVAELISSSAVSDSLNLPIFDVEEKAQSDSLGNKETTTVILLSLMPQESNKLMLENNGFNAVKYDTFEKVVNDFESNKDVCACIVDESFLSNLNEEQQKEFLADLSKLSTFLWIRIDDRGLRIDYEEVRRIIKRTQCSSTVKSENLSIQPSGVLRYLELLEIRRAQEILRVGDSVQLVPSELTKSELRLLVSAVKEHYQKYNVEEVIALDTVETRFLQGGYAFSKIILVNISGSNNFIVAKVGSKNEIFQEMGRYNNYIKDWNDSLRPVVSFYSDSAVILLDFIEDGADGSRPAPVLEGIIDDLWVSEVHSYNEADFALKITNLCCGFTRFIGSLSTLNMKKPRDNTFESRANPHVDFINRLELQGVTWGFDDEHRSARSIAQNQFRRFAAAGIAHGDLHFKNILVRNDLDFYLIDFAGSGPGHPAVDLCRMMILFFVVNLKHQINDEEYVDIVNDIFLSQKSKAEVYDLYPNLLIPITNTVCVSGCIECRDAAINVMKSHTGCYNDYIATLTLVAWQNLFINGRQIKPLKVLIRQLSAYILTSMN